MDADDATELVRPFPSPPAGWKASKDAGRPPTPPTGSYRSFGEELDCALAEPRLHMEDDAAGSAAPLPQGGAEPANAREELKRENQAIRATFHGLLADLVGSASTSSAAGLRGGAPAPVPSSENLAALEKMFHRVHARINSLRPRQARELLLAHMGRQRAGREEAVRELAEATAGAAAAAAEE